MLVRSGMGAEQATMIPARKTLARRDLVSITLDSYQITLTLSELRAAWELSG